MILQNAEAIFKMLENSKEEDEEDEDYMLYLSDDEEKDLGLPINDKQPEEDLEPLPIMQKDAKEPTKSPLKRKMQDPFNAINRQTQSQTRGNKVQQKKSGVIAT